VSRAATLARAALRWMRGSWLLRFAAVLVVVQLLLGWAFAWVGRTRGLLSPGGSIHPDVALLGALYLVMRLAARFAVPALVVGAISFGLLERFAGRPR
jgi:hypothetical protein